MNRNTLLSRLSAVLIVAAFTCAMMIFTQYEAQSFMLCVFLTGGAVLLVLGGGPIAAQIMLPKSAMLLTAALFWGLALFSAVLSAAPYISFIYFCFFSVFPLAVVLVLAAPDKAIFFRIAFGGIAMVMALLAVVSLVQYFAFNAMLGYDGRTQWPLANPNSLAGVYMMGIFGALALMLGARGRLQSNTGLALSILFMAALFTTGSRGAFISLMVGLVVFLALNSVHLKIHRRCVGIFAIVSILIFLAALYAVPESAYTLGAAFGYTAQSLDAPLQTRPAIWLSTWQIIQDYFWTGTGIGTFYLYYPQYRGEDFYSAGYMAHNDMLQFWAEMGIVAPLLFIAFILFGIRRMKRAMDVLAADDRRRILIAAPFCALGAMVLNSMVTYHFYVLPMLLLAGLAVGFWFHQTQAVAGRGDCTLSLASAKMACGVKFAPLLVLGLFLYGFAILQGSYLLTARAESRMTATGDIGEFSHDVNSAAALSHQRNDRAFVMAAMIPIGVLEAQDATLPKQSSEAFYKQGSDLLDKAQALNPRLVSAFFYRAALSRAAGRRMALPPEQAPEVFLNQALVLDPQYSAARLALADVYEQQGHASKALELLREGMKWNYVYNDKINYLERLARLALEQGDMETNREAMQQLYRYKKYEQDKAGRRSQSPLAEFRNFMVRE